LLLSGETAERSADLPALFGAAPHSPQALEALPAEPERQAWRAGLAELLPTGQGIAQDLALADCRWLRVRGRRVEPEAAGESLAALLLFADVSEEREQRLAERDRCLNLEQLLDALPVPVWQRDENLQVVACNLAYALALDRSRQSVLEQGLELLGKLKK